MYQKLIDAIGSGEAKIEQRGLQGIEELVSALGNAIEYLIDKKYPHELHLGRIDDFSYKLIDHGVVVENAHVPSQSTKLEYLTEVFFPAYGQEDLLTVAEGVKEALLLQGVYDEIGHKNITFI